MGAQQSCGKTCSNCASNCSRDGHGPGDDLDDDRPGGDPAGATFEETLEDLSSLDRQLMLFCATSNVAAVRWLLLLGASVDACDANGTSCLHVACRSGAVAVVKEIMQHRPLLQAVDLAGWTPLHVAVLMGRREVVARLLQAGSPTNVKNEKGQAPAELCADSGTFEALRSFEQHRRESPGKPWAYGKASAALEDTAGNRLQYEPFFVPRQPVVRSQQFKKDFQKIGVLIFNRQPGFGLAFLVASGIARDYPVDMSTFLRRGKVDTRQVGSFLGEAFSLSHTIRLEFINSVVLQGTGVVSALKAALHLLRLPDDLQKINRLVHGVARIWWRQHERMQRDQVRETLEPPAGGGAAGAEGRDELSGLVLKHHLASSDALHQLMFSTVLLHWYMYNRGNGEKRELDFESWRRLNTCTEPGGEDVPERVQRLVHGLISRGPCPELEVASARGESGGAAAGGGPDEGGGCGPGDAGGGTRQDIPLLAPFASQEGWAQIVGGGFPRPSSVTRQQTVTYKQISSIFSEVTHNSSGARVSPLARGFGSSPAGCPPSGRGRGALTVEALPSGPKRDDFAWLSVCYSLLFFSASPHDSAPYAFAELQKTAVASVDQDSKVLTLVGLSVDADQGGGDPGPFAGGDRPGEARTGNPIVIVLLLPDGRWQELSLQKLELRVASEAELASWCGQLSAAGSGAPVSMPAMYGGAACGAGPTTRPMMLPQPPKPTIPEPGGSAAPPEFPRFVADGANVPAFRGDPLNPV